MIRASTAAPTYFEPQVITIGNQKFIFRDGALTGYNNPTFKAFLTATLETYGLQWKTSAEDTLVVSIGTGTPHLANQELNIKQMNLAYTINNVPQALLSSSQFQQDMLCRVFGKCLIGEPLDEELGDLIDQKGPANPKLFTYLRYNLNLHTKDLNELGCGHLDYKRLSKLDDIGQLDDLAEIGKKLANKKVKAKHFKNFL